MAAETGKSGTAGEIRNTQPSLANLFLELAASMHMHHLVQGASQVTAGRLHLAVLYVLSTAVAHRVLGSIAKGARCV